jgi:hypothetical protein
MTKPTKEEINAVLTDLRRRRDDAAKIGDHATALILNDRIKNVKEGRTSPMVERVMKRFESFCERLKADRPPSIH